MRNYILLAMLLLLATRCSYTLPVKDGPTAYERKRFADAIPMLQKEFSKAKARSEKGKIAFQLADSYRRTGDDESAMQWYKTAYDNNYGPEALRGYAFSLKKNGRYNDAREQFKALGIEIGSPYEYRKEISACTVSEGWLKEAPANGWTVELAPFNSPQHDFCTRWSPDGRLVFTSDRSAATGKDNYRWTGNRFMDLFIVEPESASAQTFDPGFNSAGNDGTLCFNKSGTEVFFVRATGAYAGDDQYCKIFWTKKDFDAWATPIPMPFQKEKINYVHPVLSSDGNTLYYACNDPEGWGGFDLYYVTRQPNAESGWSDPKLMNRSINSPGNELFPALDADTLYFSSDGLPGMGGLDIFRTHRLERATWAPPYNLKSPVNSGADDFAFTPYPATSTGPAGEYKTGDLLRRGFFTSNRKTPQSRGGDDIYRFEQRVPPPKPVKIDTTPAKNIVYKMLLEGYVLEKIWSDPSNPNSKLLGRRPLDAATVQIEFGGKKQTVKVGTDGLFKLELTDNTDYQFGASKEGYLSNNAKFSTRGFAKDPKNPIQTYEVEIVLDKIFKNTEIVLENIYYDYDKWDIRPDAEPTLNHLADVLRQNPGIRIQLGSHTDCRGNDDYNQTLSQRRAESAVNYLIGRGIDADRLSAVGYGESAPADNCNCAKCSEEQHQRNRRTTFRILD